MSLNMLPPRVPIGQAQLPDGAVVNVLMSAEFARAMSDLLLRVGGPSGTGTEDLATLAAMSDDGTASVSDLFSQMDSLRHQVETLSAELARMTEIRKAADDLLLLQQWGNPAQPKYGQDLEIQYSFAVPPPDFEHPGRLGFRTPNSATVTTLTATDAVALNPVDKLVDLSPTGVGSVRIRPVAVGTMDNVIIGATTPKTGKFTSIDATGIAIGSGVAGASVTLNGTNAGVAGGATVIVLNGGVYVCAIGNKSAIVGGAYDATPYIYTNGGPLTIHNAMKVQGAWACNNKAPSASIGIPVAATDAATTQTLVNSIRTALINVGICS